MKPDASCPTCRFWQWAGTGKVGDCRRHAPVIAPDAKSTMFAGRVWPRVADHDCCGDFEESQAAALERAQDEAAARQERDLDQRYAEALAPPPGWPLLDDDEPF